MRRFAALAALVPLLAVAADARVADPTTVNGNVIGPADDYATPGPARVCMGDMVITPQAGETAYLAYAGIHSGTVTLQQTNGDSIDFAIGDSWLVRVGADQGPSWIRDNLRFYKIEQGPDVVYQVFRQQSDDNSRSVAVIVSGSGVAGNRSDREWADRLAVEPDPQDCARRYQFGWPIILGDEPLETPRMPTP